MARDYFPAESESMVLVRACWCNGRRTAWMVREVIEGQDVIFYDEMRTPWENWHACASPKVAPPSL
jgi:hypothetical protein